jgi:hypothetical protein
MGFFDSLDVGGLVDIAKVAVGVFTAVKSTKIAEDQADVAKKETRRRAALERSRVKRETRIRKATLLANQGNANAVLSTAGSGVFGLDSSLAFGLDDLDQQTGAQIDQFNLGVSNVKTQGVVDIAASLGTFAVTDTAASAGSAFTDFANPPSTSVSLGPVGTVSNPMVK